jgi:predicted nucleic acid-binding Zn ribbon protein
MNAINITCTYCELVPARPGQSTCSDRCQKAMECEDVNCPCNSDICLIDGKPIKIGEIVCSRLCAEEADIDLSLADYELIMYPHG